MVVIVGSEGIERANRIVDGGGGADLDPFGDGREVGVCGLGELKEVEGKRKLVEWEGLVFFKDCSMKREWLIGLCRASVAQVKAEQKQWEGSRRTTV